MGYHRAGFDVLGVDIRPQPNYPFEFVEADALWFAERILWDCPYGWNVASFSAIHASPPCQAHTAMNVMWNARQHPDLIAETRGLLVATRLPYVIENVPGAPLVDAVTICGASMGLASSTHDLARHRLFETNWPVMVPPCSHGSRPVLGVYGDHARDRRRVKGAANPERGTQLLMQDGLAASRELMEMPWANWRELSQAIPPAYTELIGQQLLNHIQAACNPSKRRKT
jgi:DNA (cytosine-5)-methyltransferase 1